LRISVVGEGPRDYGKGQDEKGALVLIVERILDCPAGVDFVGRPLPTMHNKRGGIERRVKLALVAAAERADDGIAIVVDNDRSPPSERINSMRRGAASAASAVPCALGLAKEAFEAWMIADEKTLGLVLKLPGPARTQRSPETIPDPKQRLNEIAGRRVTGCKLAKVAEEVDLDRLAKRCKRGFGRFKQAVIQNLRPVIGQSL